MTLTYGSVCSGIEAATEAWHPLGWRAKFFAEIDRFASEVLAFRHGSNMPGEPLAKNGIPNHGDFTKIGADAGPVDLLVGGTPCQSFSVAGKRLGLDDPRGNLALEFLGLAQRLRARWIVWENVPGVLSSFSDAPASDGGPRCPLAERQAGDEWNETHDFATFLEFVRQCGYGFAYRVLDAQHVRTQRFPRAVPQRRRRVILVGYLGDWRCAAAVLLEPQSLRGDPAPRREAGQGFAAEAAPSLVSSGRGVERAGETRGQDPVIAQPVASGFGGGNQSGPINVSSALTAHGRRQDFEVETFIVDKSAPPLTTNQYADNESREGLLVSHALRSEGFDASEDGTGRGTPIVPIAFDSKASGGPLPTDGVSPTLRAMNAAPGGRANAGGQVAVAFSIMPQNSGKDYKARPVDVAQPLMAGGPVGGNQGGDYIAEAWSVRRLTPTECARLQGFPDDHCRIPRNGKPAEECPDGPQYKAYGNSMAVNVMDWVGQRIDLMERLIGEGRFDA